MSTELVVLNNTAIQQGGLGLTNSKLFALKPSTIELVQGMSRAEGAIPGKLRISDTGQHFDEMQLVMLFEPVQQRAYFEGAEMTKGAKLCFSTDNEHPHDRAQVPQAANCARCPMQDWTKWRETKKKEDLPKCKQYWHVLVSDRVTQLPYYLNVKTTSISAFEQGMGQLAKLIALMKSRGENPNIFDVSFKISPVKVGPNYQYAFKEFAPIKAEDRAKFGAIFLDFANRRVNNSQEQAEAEAAAEAEVVIPDTSFVQTPAAAAPVTINQAGEIVI